MSVLEFMLAVAIVGILMVAFLDRVDGYRETVERTAMEQLAREIGWALRLRAAELMLTNRNDEIGGLEGANPVEALDMQIAGYAGSGATAGEAQVPAGRWYFNRETHELVYFPALTSGYATETGKRPRIAWRAAVVLEPARPGGKPRPQWVRFELVQPYRWVDNRGAKNASAAPMVAFTAEERRS